VSKHSQHVGHIVELGGVDSAQDADLLLLERPPPPALPAFLPTLRPEKKIPTTPHLSRLGHLDVPVKDGLACTWRVVAVQLKVHLAEVDL
jgi:hypothetical protein